MIVQSAFYREIHPLNEQTPMLLPKAWRKMSMKQLTQLAQKVADHSLCDLSDDELKKVIESINIHHLDACFSGLVAIHEAIFRTLGLKPYWTQVLAALVALNQNIAEMDTGEGKSLATLIAACWASGLNWPVHIITANDYLAQRDAQEARPLGEFLDVHVTCLFNGQDTHERKAAFDGKWCFTTGKELVFEFLRDKLYLRDANDPIRHAFLNLTEGEQSDRPYFKGLGLALIDEADSVLIDEASTPCVISGAGGKVWDILELKEALSLARSLLENEHFVFDETARMIQLLDLGKQKIAIQKVSESLQNLLYRKELVMLGLKADYLFLVDRDYVINDDKIVIIDGLTGRMMPDRRWEQGLHEMLEIKHNLTLSSSRKALGKLTYQQFFKHYHALGGMTGTAKEVSAELHDVYALNTQKIPRFHKLQRTCADIIWCRDEGKKRQHLLSCVEDIFYQQRAILIGAASVEESLKISDWLTTAGFTHQVLNGVQDYNEAELIAEAGHPGRITVATSVAGRGTDIKLDDAVAKAGGLHVLMLSFLKFSRMDRQLIGRAARQNDPGSYTILCGSMDDLLKNERSAAFIYRLGKQVFTLWVNSLQSKNEKKATAARIAVNLWEEDRKQWLSFLKNT